MAPRGSSQRQEQSQRLLQQGSDQQQKDNTNKDNNNNNDNTNNTNNTNNNNNNNNNDDKDNNDKKDTEFPSAAPSFPPSTAPPTTGFSTRLPTRFPTRLPTLVPSLTPTTVKSTPTPATGSPTLIVAVGRFECLFSVYSPEISPEVQETTLTEILNTALCGTGTHLVTAAGEDSCPGTTKRRRQLPQESTADSAGDATVVWDTPLVESQWMSVVIKAAQNQTLEYWQWNFTYQILTYGQQQLQQEGLLQIIINESITTGTMDTALEQEWPTTSWKTRPQTSPLGMEETYFVSNSTSSPTPSPSTSAGAVPMMETGSTAAAAKALRVVGIALVCLPIFGVVLLTILARRHRERSTKVSIAIPPMFCAKDNTTAPPYSLNRNGELPSVEAMLRQSRQFVKKHPPPTPPHTHAGVQTTTATLPPLLPAVSFDDGRDGEDDVDPLELYMSVLRTSRSW